MVLNCRLKKKKKVCETNRSPKVKRRKTASVYFVATPYWPEGEGEGRREEGGREGKRGRGEGERGKEGEGVAEGRRKKEKTAKRNLPRSPWMKTIQNPKKKMYGKEKRKKQHYQNIHGCTEFTQCRIQSLINSYFWKKDASLIITLQLLSVH